MGPFWRGKIWICTSPPPAVNNDTSLRVARFIDIRPNWSLPIVQDTEQKGGTKYGPEGWPVFRKSVGLKKQCTESYGKFQNSYSKNIDTERKGGNMYGPEGWPVFRKSVGLKKNNALKATENVKIPTPKNIALVVRSGRVAGFPKIWRSKKTMYLNLLKMSKFKHSVGGMDRNKWILQVQWFNGC